MSTVTRMMGQLVERATTRPRSRWFRLVTSALDAHGTRFLPEGGDLSEHRQNPIVVWNHGTSTRKDGTPPDPRHAIGTVAEYDQTAAALDILVEFDTEPLADLIWRKVEKGIIRACSLGAIPTEVEERSEDGVKVPVFTRWILKEASVCMLGSNPEAMALTRELEALTRTPSFAGISMVCLYPDAESREALNQATPPGVDPEQYHVTLAAFDDDQQPEGWRERVHPIVPWLMAWVCLLPVPLLAANAYIHFHNVLLAKRKWYRPGTIMAAIPSLMAAANPTLDTDFRATPKALRLELEKLV